METLKARGAEFTDTEPRPGAVGQVAFMPPTSTGGVLVEINQEISAASPDPLATQAAEGVMVHSSGSDDPKTADPTSETTTASGVPGAATGA